MCQNPLLSPPREPLLSAPAIAAPTPAVPPGFCLPCPLCGEAQASIFLDLTDHTAFTCQDCNENFSRADLDQFIDRWMKVLSWIDSAPKMEG